MSAKTMPVAKRAAAALLAMSTAAGAAAAASPTHEVVGKIQHLNPHGHHLTVKSRTYSYDPAKVGAHLNRGEEVRILYRESHGHRTAIRILPAA